MNVTTPPIPPHKPGYKTTEFWATLVTFLVAGLIQTGVIPTEGEGPWPSLVALGLQAAAGMGYAISRGVSKIGKLAVVLAACLALSGCSGGSFRSEGAVEVIVGADCAE